MSKRVEIAFWNIKWFNRYEDKSSTRIENNHVRARIAYKILNDSENTYDILVLAEAGNKQSLEIKGYKKIYLNRNRKNLQNGILLYGKEELNLEVDIALYEELKRRKIDCFMPIKSIINEKSVHFLFVWTTTKEYENGKKVPYGYFRFKELLNLKLAKDFLDGNKHKVFVIGDFNVNSNPVSHDKKKKLKKWEEIKSELESCGLEWVENHKITYGETAIIDHAFLSSNMLNKANLDIKKRIYENIESDHNLIHLTAKL